MYHFKNLLIVGLLFLSSAFTLKAQNEQDASQKITVSGTVVDQDHLPLIGAGIIINGVSNSGVITDLDGHYIIKGVPSEGVLLFTCLGMENQYVNVKGRVVIDVTMTEAAYALEEVRVVSIGYGSVQKKDLTGSVASVKGETISEFTTSSVTTALQGRLAGVEVRSSGSEPGATAQIRVRGTNSINGGNDPLWIVDGFPGMPNMLNTSDIESVEVLKDASATAIYGSRGGNGVIIVTTKKGKEGTTRVDFNASAGVSMLAKKLDVLNAQEYMQYQNIMSTNISGKPYFSDEDIAGAKTTDWQDLEYGNAVTQDYSLSVRGSVKSTKFSLGASWLDQNGILRGSAYDKISLRTSVNHDFSKKWNFSMNIIYGRTIHDKQGGLTSSILQATPTVEPYDENGDYTLLRSVYPFSPSALNNPEAQLNERSYHWTSNRTMANGAIIFKPIEDLVIKAAVNVNASNARQDNYITTKYPNSTGSASIDLSESQQLSSDNTITYSKSIAKHKFSIMGGATYEQYFSKGVGVSGTGFLSDLAGTYGIASAEIQNTPSASYSKWAMLSFLGRINYSYDNRYLVTVNFRADGSSRYSVGNKWGYFPSVALAWRLSEEKWMKDIKVINNLKLRAGYGESGNTAISPYATLDLLTTESTIFNKSPYVVYHPSSYYKYGLRWETTSQFDAGIDLGMFKSRLNLTIDYYFKNTYNLLNTVELAASTGYINGTKNVGTMQNQGVEISLDGRIIDRAFKWDMSLNLAINRNKVVSLPYGEDVYGTKRSITIVNDYINLLREGEPIGVFYGYVEEGYDNEGKIVYKDVDGNNKINEYDKQIIGDPNPDFTFGLSTSFSWKGISLSAFFQGSVGNDIYSLSMASLCHNYSGSRGINTLKEVLYDHWTPENTNAKYPNLTPAATSSLKMSDRFVYDGSYMRLKNLEVSYQIPTAKVKWIRNITVFVSGQNLFTITKYPFYDPDVNTYGGSSSVNQGIDYYSYPLSKSFTGGLRMSF